ncbi:YceI family protein [Simiduia aestuariiviva]|uniref:Polyisoprenoid-binding protein YceI n=1 Tax=Simiduia aestuariiviva TaxID=1510459 RepID=A0A839UW17_9GAMM|nr:YceI family protein [Simiduia aestuariiviva]MBB3169547.1 polyisoprenoid-binding protein YceI [Simiduia aestuariiviva]
MTLPTLSRTLLAGASLWLAATGAHAADYVIDSKGAHASVNFAIQHLGYSWLTGRFNTFEGSFSYDAEKPAESQVNVTIDTQSVDSNHAERDKHLRSKDFLNADKHPKATFVSTKVSNVKDGGFELAGNLTLNGVTKPVTINVTKVGEGKDPWGGYRAGFSGETKLNLKDFNINYNLGPASESVKLWLNVEGVRQK